MKVRDTLQFILNGKDVTLRAVAPDATLLDFLRLERRLTGTKEGCAEGDCGACTVLVGRLRGGEIRYEPINACIRFLASLDGCHVVSIEHLAGDGSGAALHPVQQAMVDHHASQCGFCTPGIVMALYALWMTHPDPTRDQAVTALQGNLCRCTGYAPIIRAAMDAGRYGAREADRLVAERQKMHVRLAAIHDGRRVELRHGRGLSVLPANCADLAEVLVEHPDATIVAGATDVGLWVTKALRRIDPAVFIGHLEPLRQVTKDETAIRIGAGASYDEASEVLLEAFPHLQDYWNRIAGWQIRSAGTIGGNIANGSPIGDTPPVLIALGAELLLRSAVGVRRIPLERFFLEYGKQDLAPGEFVEEITVPRPAKDSLHAAYKVSKRRDEDISSVAVAFHVIRNDGRVTQARIAFGGMAGVPKRARAAEAALIGQPWGEAAFLAAAARLADDFTPLSDWRASAAYRMLTARNLFRRFFLEHQSGAEAARLQRA